MSIVVGGAVVRLVNAATGCLAKVEKCGGGGGGGWSNCCCLS